MEQLRIQIAECRLAYAQTLRRRLEEDVVFQLHAVELQRRVEHRAEAAMEQVQAILAIEPQHQQANRLVGHLYMVQGDTLKGVEYLDRFTEHYREGRSAELFDQLKEQWDEKLQGPQS